MESIYHIFKTNLDVKTDEKVLVFSDGYSVETDRLGALFAEAGRAFTDHIKHVTFTSTGCHGVEPPEEIWKKSFGKGSYDELKYKRLLEPLLTKRISGDALQDVKSIIKNHSGDAVHVVIAMSYFSTSHTRFREFLNTICGTRYASMPLFDRQMLEGPMRVDSAKMLQRSEYIAARINESEYMEIESENGTYLELSKKGREARIDTGIITQPGSFSNLPAGEVYLAPLEGTASGRLVLEWAPTRKLKTPVTIHIEDGMAVEVTGDEEFAAQLFAKLSEQNENRNIAELGIGTNEMASRPDNILESEKIFGTIHVALGDNSSFGGEVQAPFHQDFIFFRPDVNLIDQDGNKRQLLKNGIL